MAGHKGEEARPGQGIGLKLVFGLLLLVLGVYLMWIWKEDVRTLIKGAGSIIIMAVAVMVLAMAKE